MKRMRLGTWTVDVAHGHLARGNEFRPLEPRQLDVLLCLASANGQVVSKEELLREVWGDRFVVEHVVPKTISGLRHALGESARQPSVIVTVGRRGYRLGCPAVEVDIAGPETSPNHVAPADRAGGALRLAAAAALGALLMVPLTQGLTAPVATAPERVEIKTEIRWHEVTDAPVKFDFEFRTR